MGLGSHLLDHTCNVHRLTETLGTFRETVQGYAQVHTDLECTFQRRNTVIGEEGPGLRAVGDRRVYLNVGPAFQDRDIVELVTGPAGFVGPQLLEVESFAAPRGHHLELRCSEWEGTLPPEGS